jgi:hypothetical protein
MFSKRAALNGARKYSREFFQKLVGDLSNSGFDEIHVLLPHNLVKVGESTVAVTELLTRERNYPAIILLARSTSKDETLKVLFVNKNSKAVFIDDTFPNAESEPPQLYFQSPDPGRTYAVFEFFREYLQTPSLASYRFAWITGYASLFFLILQVFFLVSQKMGLLQTRFNWYPIWDFAITILGLALMLRFFAYPRGLWIKPEREFRPLYLLNMAIRGEFRDNPLVSLILSILGTVIAAFILKWLGVIK